MGTAAPGVPTVSVILPCYREAAVARASVAILRETLENRFPRAWEILVVDDGGGDFPDDTWSSAGPVQLLRLPENRGKGAAVRVGMLAARGHVRIYTDADLPYEADLIPIMASYLLDDPFHMVVGDRNLGRSSFDQRPTLARRVLSSAATFFIGTLVTGGVFDTQCGIKGIRGQVADLLLPLVTIERFAFDVELVYLALRFNCDIKRVPVRFVERGTSSTVRPFIDAARSLRDLFRIKRNAMTGRYESSALDQLVWRDFDRRSQTWDERQAPE